MGTHKCEKLSQEIQQGWTVQGPVGKIRSLIFIVRLLCVSDPGIWSDLPSKEGMQPAGRCLLLGQERGWAIGETRNHHLSIRAVSESGGV